MYENGSKEPGAEDENQEAVKKGTGPLTLALINIQPCYHFLLILFSFCIRFVLLMFLDERRRSTEEKVQTWRRKSEDQQSQENPPASAWCKLTDQKSPEKQSSSKEGSQDLAETKEKVSVLLRT